jgi:hypothetical protein
MKENRVTDQEEYRCDHCKRSFVRPSSFINHMCEQKRRWTDKDKPQNRIAFAAWLNFYKTIQPSRKKRAYVDFTSNAYYNGFIKYGTYCVEVGVVNPERYAEYLLKENIPLDNWNSDKVYTKYLIFYLRSEDGMDAVRRSIDNMLTLSENENVELRDVFRYINVNKICQYICSGKISPWVLYLSTTGAEFLSKLNDDQRSVIFEYIDPERWNIKFKRDSAEAKNVSEVLNQIQGL